MSVICDTLTERLRRDTPGSSRSLAAKDPSPTASLENVSSLNRYLGTGSGTPAAETYEPGLEPAGSPLARRASRHISVLLAEERTIMREGIGALLEAEDNITVVGQTSDCGEALSLADKLHPDVVIVAIRMALRCGLESFRRNIEARCGARVLVLVPHNDNNALTEHVCAAGAAASVTEQASARMLAAAVRDAYWKDQSFDRGPSRYGSSSAPGFDSHGVAAERNVTRLTLREREVLQFIAEGNGNKQTASKLSISVKTVEKHRQSIMDKLGIHETATLTRYAMYAGIVQ